MDNYQIPSGYTLLELRELDYVTYEIYGKVGCSKTKDTLVVVKTTARGATDVWGSVTVTEYAECLYEDIETVTYNGFTE